MEGRVSQLYARDGVHLSLEHAFSTRAAEVARGTWGNSPFLRVHDRSAEGFRGPKVYEVVGISPVREIDASDGLGTKPELISAAGTHGHAGADLFAMTATDIVRHRAIPLRLANVLCVASLGSDTQSDTFRQLCAVIEGLGAAASLNNMVLSAGETAQHGFLLRSMHRNPVTVFEWSGCASGVEHPMGSLTGVSVVAGDDVVGLFEYGLRCNGNSMAREALRLHFGDDWAENPEACEARQSAAAPSTSYIRFLNFINGWETPPAFRPVINVHAYVHVTGGGIPLKLGDTFCSPLGLEVELDDLHTPSQIQRDIASWRGADAFQIYKVLNCGQGLLAIMHPDDTKTFCAFARDHQLVAKRCGRVLRRGSETPRIVIHSKFSNEELVYTPADWI